MADRSLLRRLSVCDTPPTGDLGERRRQAVADAAEQARQQVAMSSAPSSAVALTGFGAGCVVLALAGTFDHAEVAAVRALRGELSRLAPVELVVELSGLTAGQPALAQAVAGLRVSRLSAGARVELHAPPPELRAVLGVRPAEVYTVHEDLVDLRIGQRR